MLTHLESLRAFIYAAERDPVFSKDGLALPNPLYVQLGRVSSLEQHPRVLEAVRELRLEPADGTGRRRAG